MGAPMWVSRGIHWEFVHTTAPLGGGHAHSGLLELVHCWSRSRKLQLVTLQEAVRGGRGLTVAVPGVVLGVQSVFSIVDKAEEEKEDLAAVGIIGC